MTYYGRFYRSRLYPFLQRIYAYLMRWARKKYKLMNSYKRVKAWWLDSSIESPGGEQAASTSKITI